MKENKKKHEIQRRSKINPSSQSHLNLWEEQKNHKQKNSLSSGLMKERLYDPLENTSLYKGFSDPVAAKKDLSHFFDWHLLDAPPLPMSSKQKNKTNNTQTEVQDQSIEPDVEQLAFFEKVQAILEKRQKQANTTKYRSFRVDSKLKVMNCGSFKSPGLAAVLIVMSGGAYWSFWVRRILFELCFSLNITLESKHHSSLQPFLKYSSYTHVVKSLIKHAQSKSTSSIYNPSLLAYTAFVPPLFVAYVQHCVNSFYKADKK